jgi:hypothetical protein
MDLAFEHETIGGRDEIEPGGLRTQLAKRGAGNVDAGHGRIACGHQPVDIGLGNKPAVNQFERAVIVGLGDACIGLGHGNLRRLARLLLDLHRTVDHGENLPLTDPVPRIDPYINHHSAFADRADRHFAPRGQDAGGVYRAGDGRLAGRNNADRRRLPGRRGRAIRIAAMDK